MAGSSWTRTALLGLAALAMALAGCGKKVGEGKRCKGHAECKKGLKCVNGRCADLSGTHPACKWSITCLRLLDRSLSGKDEDMRYRIVDWLKKLSKAPYVSDCKKMPEHIAEYFNKKPWLWKRRCGPPPVKGVALSKDKSNPFEVLEKQIKASQVPNDAPQEVRDKHNAYPDVCKAWVKFALKRDFQGYVRAKLYEQYDCQEPTKEEKKKAKEEKRTPEPKCKTRIYSKDARKYLPLHARGSEFAVIFYISTPPSVCKKPNLGSKEYKSGCFCLGIDEKKIRLEWQDEPFLYLDGTPKKNVLD